MITAETKFKAKFPSFIFQKDLKYIADRIFIPIMQQNIHQQMTLDGGNFPPLEQSTAERKSGAIVKRTFTQKGNLRAGVEKKISKTGLTSFVSKTLIDTGKLVSSFFSAEKGTNQVIISLRGDRKEIGGYLQIEGVGKKKKKFNFFGISTRMQEEAIKYMQRKIKDLVRNV